MFDAKDNKKYQVGFDYRLPMASNWSFTQFGEVIYTNILGFCWMKWYTNTMMGKRNG